MPPHDPVELELDPRQRNQNDPRVQHRGSGDNNVQQAHDVNHEYHVDLLGNSLDSLHEHVSPYALALMLACAMDVNAYTAYGFVACFLVCTTIECGRLVHALYHQGLLRWIWRHVHDYATFVVRHMRAMRDVYLVKVVTSLLLMFIVASLVVWLRRVDILQLARDTLTFVVELPALLLNQHKLILAIHDWLHRVFLDHVVWTMSTIWRWQRELIQWSPSLGLLCIAAQLGVVTLLICVASMFSQSSYRVRLDAWASARVNDLIAYWNAQPGDVKVTMILAFFSFFALFALMARLPDVWVWIHAQRKG